MTVGNRTDFSVLLAAAGFAEERHRRQLRKGADGLPYITHPLAVATILAEVGRVEEVTLLVAALLHDTVEDTRTTAEELEALFGSEVRQLVDEVSDDKSLQKDVRKKLQVEHAASASRSAKQLKLADKICNVRYVTLNPPEDWTLERRLAYLDWAEAVVAGCRGVNRPLEQCFDESVAEGRLALGGLTA